MTRPANDRIDLRYDLAELGAEVAPEDPLRLMHRKLRGRYPIVVTFTVALGVLGGLLGYQCVSPKYESTGIIRVTPTRPTILYQSEENQVPPLFDSYVAAQAGLVSSRAILDAALRDRALIDAGWPQGDQGAALLKSSLRVDHRRGDQVIYVTVTHANPFLAQTATNAMLAAVERSYHEPGGLSTEAKERMLVEREEELQAELDDLREQVLVASNQYGAATANQLHLTKIQELVAIDQKLDELAFAIVAIDPSAAPEAIEGGTTGSASVFVGGPTEGLRGPLADLEEQELAVLAQIEAGSSRFSAQHPMIRDLNRQLETIRMHKRLREEALASMPVGVGVDLGLDVKNASLDQLVRLREHYRSMRATVQEEAAGLGRMMAEIAGVQERISATTRRLDDTRSRLDQLRVESSRAKSARVSVAALADLPLTPTSDRRAALAGAGSLFGAFTAIATVFIIGLLDRRYRFADELGELEPMAPLIGMLPDVSDSKNGNLTTATLGVHQLRSLLQLESADHRHPVITITSALNGEGKTSLALAIANSFAASGRKTLLIDADLVRRTLTKEIHLEHRPGLCQAVGPDDATCQAYETTVPNLWALPVGTPGNLNPERVSHERLSELISEVRHQFDTILIDTGPILTSLEATLFAAICDQVIVVVARGQRIDPVHAAVDRIQRIGADRIGLVFNLARPCDFNRCDRIVHQPPRAIVPLVPQKAKGSAPVPPAPDTLGRVGPVQAESSPDAAPRRAA